MSNHRILQRELEKVISRDRIIVREHIPPKYFFDALRPHRPYPKLRRLGYKPTVLVRPETAEETIAIIQVARRVKLPVVPYGGGTGLMGAAIAVHGGIMVDASRMNRIDRVSEQDMQVHAQAGVVLEDLYVYLQRRGLLFAHDPWTRPIATVGGAVSTNSLGYLGAKYGSIGNQLLGLAVVMPDGRSLKTRPAQFSSTGFDLKRLFVGTEGQFGFVTSATIRTFPEPEKFVVAAYDFPTFEHGYRAIMRMRASGVKPSMVDYGEETPQLDNATPARLDLAFDGLEDEVEVRLRKTSEIARAHDGIQLEEKAAVEFWEHRHDIALTYQRRAASSKRLTEEPRTKYDYVHVSLPASRIPHFRRQTLHLAQRAAAKVLEVGLWHGPELFSIVLSAKASDPKEAARKLWKTSNSILICAQEAGGSMEYCHGVGLKLAHLMEQEHGIGLDIMRRIKHAVDPLNIMNPGKAALRD